MPKEPKAKVLVVEDNEPVWETLRVLLEDEFYILTVSTGVEALEILRQHKDIAAVTTSTLRGQLINGFVLLRETKKLYPPMKVVLVTGASPAQIQAETAFFDGIVYKPFLNVLPSLIAVLIDKRIVVGSARNI